ncbi:extracellular catalytic domain type 2 short-chain-length polyhydroxyalkanoate depolymerase [Neptunomonas qingdaonensis]|uniref:Poly(3-hydroxybutyrate) depolymerase n=1 Tax=Neptunomonas qingdaonensis TaxID=1045558 RepID=A0A1I2V0H5_9GAMM|nr:poly(3-hydroxybutyrate) depolymerase [Neptunomonas qingdaonensis]SFG80681.1 hypothetical protein SAMN05216175_11454 [Neptunomonas qingdaonensis]
MLKNILLVGGFNSMALSRLMIRLMTLLLIMLAAHTASAIQPRLPGLNALPDQTSISGLSSGAFMASQFHVAYSKDLVGAAIIAGGPWNCASTFSWLSPLNNALTSCMDPCKYTWFICPAWFFPNGSDLAAQAKDALTAGEIDDLSNLLDDKVYIFSGRNDDTVVTGVVDATQAFYRALGLPDEHIFYNKSIDAGHAFITNDASDAPCDVTQSPYINNCDIAQARKLLAHIYGELNEAPVLSPMPEKIAEHAVEPEAEKMLHGELLRFNQKEFLDTDNTSMDDDAYVYIPQSCTTEQCRVHVSLHGCRQGISVIGTTYIEETGYNEVADNNNLIILYPQVKKSSINPINPRGCWDFWGYTSANLPPFTYAQKDAPQMKAIKKMIDRLTSSAQSAVTPATSGLISSESVPSELSPSEAAQLPAVTQ